ncbi:nuclear transport factor 2 family protein [Novosphingobium malaysiense]|uniref:nuclear transport factor 2 family protein n=1 Tax=Novosphingobium malaysiense TaxID=1348853 RepID=UPI00068C41CC|nr:nuclear transport factor 2 family protein [Novosphingobium malaysiense]
MADDYSQIVNLVNLYAVATDSHRYELFERIFAHDVHLDVGGGVSIDGLDVLMSSYRDIHAEFSATQHMTSGHTVSIDGDEAQCFSYVCGRFRRVLEGGEGLFEMTGWYDDVLRRTPEGWRIGNRISRMVSFNGDLTVMQAMPGVDTNYVLSALFEEADAGRISFLSKV